MYISILITQSSPIKAVHVYTFGTSFVYWTRIRSTFCNNLWKMQWLPVFALVLVIGTLVSASPTLPPPYTEECVEGRYPAPSKDSLEEFKIDLDLPPTQRWNNLVAAKKSVIVGLVDYIKDFVRHLGKLGIIAIDFVDKDFGLILDTLPSPYKEEMQGIAQAVNLPAGDIVLYNIFYEIFQVCTSIVAQGTDGSMYHGRNLDFGLFLGWDLINNTWGLSEALRPALINLDMQKGGKTVFKAVNFAGYVGILTGVKPGVFSVTINSRFDKDGGYDGIIAWLLGNHTEHWVSFLTRESLTQAVSFADARHTLATLPLTAPVYYTLGGPEPGQGSVITRSRSKAVDTWHMTNKTNPGAPWYILQTNYDHWKAPLFLDDRRTPAHRCMQRMGQDKAGFVELFNVLSSRPVLNKLTTYTALMNIKTGRLEAYKQYCEDPCWPF